MVRRKWRRIRGPCAMVIHGSLSSSSAAAALLVRISGILRTAGGIVVAVGLRPTRIVRHGSVVVMSIPVYAVSCEPT